MCNSRSIAGPLVVVLCIGFPANLVAQRTAGDLPGGSAKRRLEYNRDIRPILSNNCFKCHGLDEKSRKAGLRLDDRQQATTVARSGVTPIVPGNPAESELIRRVF